MPYPWYETVQGKALEQGDILFDCPVVLGSDLSPESLEQVRQGEQPESEISISLADVIIMTQSCDLQHENSPDVALCGLKQLNNDMGKATLKEIKTGKRPNLHLLNEFPDQNLPLMVVTFHPIYSMTKATVEKFAEGAGDRVRLLPPYREHLAQAFARYFIRVGLPSDIPDASIEKYAQKPKQT